MGLNDVWHEFVISGREVETPQPVSYRYDEQVIGISTMLGVVSSCGLDLPEHETTDS